ncbi:DoxX family protein [Streptomyces sp. NPDC007088]|uniref:DoxX family protein n=1 Tax=Streptomyces sp. NPDC007088 TaxID=3364773 RepID=UPI003681484F
MPPYLLHRAQPYVLGLFRIVVGLLFAFHGSASLFGFPGGRGGTVPAGEWPGWYAAVIQLVGGLLVLAGPGTRTAAFIASGSMAFAYFHVHQPQALLPLQNGGEPSVLFCWALLLLVFTGPGALSLGQLWAPRATRAGASPVVEAPVTAEGGTAYGRPGGVTSPAPLGK